MCKCGHAGSRSGSSSSGSNVSRFERIGNDRNKLADTYSISIESKSRLYRAHNAERAPLERVSHLLVGK